jgi:hypothetical protein
MVWGSQNLTPILMTHIKTKNKNLKFKKKQIKIGKKKGGFTRKTKKKEGNRGVRGRRKKNATNINSKLFFFQNPPRAVSWDSSK